MNEVTEIFKKQDHKAVKQKRVAAIALVQVKSAQVKVTKPGPGRSSYAVL